MVVDWAGDMSELPSRGDGYLFCKDAYTRIRWFKVNFSSQDSRFGKFRAVFRVGCAIVPSASCRPGINRRNIMLMQRRC